MTRTPHGGASERWISGWILLLAALGLVVFLWRAEGQVTGTSDDLWGWQWEECYAPTWPRGYVVCPAPPFTPRPETSSPPHRDAYILSGKERH